MDKQTQDQTKVEKGLRKHQHLCGTWLLLGNGEQWCVPALPLSKAKRQTLMDKIETCSVAEDAIVESALSQVKQQDQSKEVVAKNRVAVEQYMEAAADLGHAALQLNYPGLTREKFDELDLLSVQHIHILMTCLKGEHDLGEVIGVSLCDEGEGQRRTKV